MGLLRLPVASATIALFSALLFSLASVHYGLAVLAIWLGFFLYSRERVLTRRLLIPPAMIVGVPWMANVGLGIPMFLYAQNITFSEPHLIMQIVFIVGFPVFWAACRIGQGRLPSFDWPYENPKFRELVERPLCNIAFILFAFDVGKIVIGILTGSLDRGDHGDFIVDQMFGIWSPFLVVNRWGQMWFFLLPIIWRRLSVAARFVMAGVCVAYLIAVFAIGTRGLLLYPICYVLLGGYLFGGRRFVNVERIALLVVPLILVLIYLMDIYRNTDQFRGTPLRDIGSRLTAVTSVEKIAKERSDFALITGRALIGVADDLVYEATPVIVDFAGVADVFDAIQWTWVPYFFKRDRPLLIDGNSIVVSYTGVEYARSQGNISFSADIYRRLGWAYVPMALCVAGCVYGLVVRLVFRTLVERDVVVGTVMTLFIFGGLQFPFFSTLLHSWWIWAYDVPKNLLILVIVVRLLSRPAGMWSFDARGLLGGASVCMAPRGLGLQRHARK